jgi:hypothetical protein
VLSKEDAKVAFMGGHRLASAPPEKASDEDKEKARQKFVQYARFGGKEVVCTPFHQEDLEKYIPDQPTIVD